MDNVKELYILSEPIETEIGNIDFLKVRDYPRLMQYIPYLEIEKFEVLTFLRKMDKKIADDLKDLSFLDLIHGLENVLELHSKFTELFQLCFNENVFGAIKTDEEFEKYRDMIRKLNGISHEVKNPNAEIQRFNDMKKLYEKQKSNGGITFEAIYTSVWAFTGTKPLDMTLYELYALFNRISQFKNYETTTLYNTVSGEVQIDPWYKHISINEEEIKTSLEEFSKSANSVMD